MFFSVLHLPLIFTYGGVFMGFGGLYDALGARGVRYHGYKVKVQTQNV